MNNEQQFARLPRWAQAELRKLRADVEYLESQLAEIQNADGPVSHIDFLNPPVGIPEYNTVVFQLATDKIDVSLRDGKVRISARNETIRIAPGGTNVIYVWSER